MREQARQTDTDRERLGGGGGGGGGVLCCVFSRGDGVVSCY